MEFGLVCPACKKPLVLEGEGQSLKCGQCHRVYPIRDGIPILLIDEAVIEKPFPNAFAGTDLDERLSAIAVHGTHSMRRAASPRTTNVRFGAEVGNSTPVAATRS